MGSYLRLLCQNATDVESGAWRLALSTASPNAHVRQIRELASIARDVLTERQFRAEVSRPGRTNRDVRERLRHFDKVITAAIKVADLDDNVGPAGALTWQLLKSLHLRELRLEGNDETDRTQAIARLRQVTADRTNATADRLFSRLCELVGRYAPAAATKDESTLRRDLAGFPLTPPTTSSTSRFSAPPKRSSDGIDNSVQVAELSEPPVRSNYISQVRRIAPDELVGREKELSHLAEFCTSLESEPYLWWRAKAWAGKSALLSSFVLNPPANVRIVSFFITARLAGQADRIAFSDVVLEQFLEIVGEPMPPLLSDATREAHLLGSLERAAEICRQRGERLVLVVDGLDEDQGVTVGPDAHSIAALLPSHLPADMRVIVASRPHPPIPADVPDDHPLRQHVAIRSLTVSAHAEVVRQDAERELKRLLRGNQTELDLLGLLTAAGGGLTATDLAELTGLSTWEIEDYLSAVSGRTFMSRAGRLRPDAVYMLGHEELQQQAASFLGARRLEAYQQTLYSWADDYSRRQWPPETPEYLLRGYFKLLRAVGDQQRMLACATDPHRHDRMLDLIGGDTSALAEITTAQEVIASQDEPDLSAMSRLSIHRVRLSSRNDNMPANLPGVWAKIGYSDRAEALARSITVPFRRVQALAAVAREVADSGDLSKATKITIQAEQAVDDVADDYDRAQAVAVVARAAAKAGESRRARILINDAETMASALTDIPRQGQVLASIARAVACVGNVSRASRIAHDIPAWSERALALMAVATESASAGDTTVSRRIAHSIRSRSERAQALSAVARAEHANGAHRKAIKTIAIAESTARAIRNPSRQVWTLVSVALGASDIRRTDTATEILRSAERLVNKITKPSDQDDALTVIARVTATVGDAARARRLVREVNSPSRRVKALAGLASGLASAGCVREAIDIASETEQSARKISSPSQSVKGLAALSQAVAAAGDVDRAERIAAAISALPQRERTLTVVAEAIARSGDLERAITLATSMTDESQRDKALSIIASVAATAGDLAGARRVVSLIQDPARQTKELTVFSKLTRVRETQRQSDGSPAPGTPKQLDCPEEVWEPVSTGDFSTAKEKALSIDEPYGQFKAMLAISCAVAASGDINGAQECISLIENIPLRAKAYVSLGETLVQSGEEEDMAKGLLDRAVVLAGTIPSLTYRQQVTAQIVQRLAEYGDLDRAETVTRSMAASPEQQKALAAIAVSAARAGRWEQAKKLANSITESRKRDRALYLITETGVREGSLEAAEEIARSIAYPIPQSQALGVVARAFATAGQIERAKEVAFSIAHLPEQARALTVMASNVAPAYSRDLLAQALAVGHWQICLPVLVRTEPDVISVMSEEFLRTTG